MPGERDQHVPKPSPYGPVNVASQKITEAIHAIEPSHAGPDETYWPCSLVLSDGQVVPRAVCRVNRRWSDNGDWINPENVSEVRPSPYRLPAALADKLYKAGESGMGYVIYIMKLRSRRSLVCSSGGIVDFPGLPEGVVGSDIIDVYPHKGRERSRREGCLEDAPFEWCDYVRYEQT